MPRICLELLPWGLRQKSHSFSFCRGTFCFSPVSPEYSEHKPALIRKPVLQMEPYPSLQLCGGLISVPGSRMVISSIVNKCRIFWWGEFAVEFLKQETGSNQVIIRGAGLPGSVHGIATDQIGRIGVKFVTVIASSEKETEGWLSGQRDL